MNDNKIIKSINLRDLFTLPYEDDRIPSWVESENCIYRIKNLINGKSYIGQARWFYGRFISKGFNHLDGYVSHCIEESGTVLYRAIKKYKSRNFNVDILEYNLSPLDLNSHESYWINYYHTYVGWDDSKGYNMNTGGGNCEQLHTQSAYNTQLSNHNGLFAFNTPEAYETNRRNHGGVLAWNTEKSLDTNRKNHEGILAWNTKESYDKQRINHGGVLAFNTPESKLKSLNKQKENHNGLLACHTDSARESAELSKWFSYSYRYLKDCNNSVELYFRRCTWCHIDYLRLNYSYLRSDNRWTNFYEEFYKFLIDNKIINSEI